MNECTPISRSPARARVMIVDDDPHIASSLAVALERHGYAAILVENGNEALAFLRAEPVELVITDVFMPECDGFEFLRACWRIAPRPRVLAITGGPPEMLRIARLLGAEAGVRKPFELGALLETMARLLASPPGHPPGGCAGAFIEADQRAD